MLDLNVALPSKPKAIREEGNMGIFEIEGLYPGYGHTLGNSLRRIILSSIPGAAITSLKIDGVLHEFSTLDGVKEDVVAIILNLKKVRFKMHSEEPQIVTIKAKGPKIITAADIVSGSQVEVLTPEQYICELTSKNEFAAEMRIEVGLGYLPKEMLQKEKVEIGTIALDAAFTPIRRANYEVETMRVGDRTDFNRLKISIETDGTLTPRQALEHSIEVMIHQLKAIVGFKEEEILPLETVTAEEVREELAQDNTSDLDTEFLKTRIENLNLAARTQNALAGANIRTVGGLVRKTEEDLMAIDGLGEKGVQEIKRALSNFGVTLKQ
jgi:DNA-directed RNA polymerase subunit alpha